MSGTPEDTEGLDLTWGNWEAAMELVKLARQRGIQVVLNSLAFTADGVDLGAIGDVMDDRGWNLDRQTPPDALHMMLSPKHGSVADRFIEDLREAVKRHGQRPALGREDEGKR